MTKPTRHFSFGVVVVTAATIGMVLVLSPFWKAVFWAVVLSILFWPLRERMVHWLGGRTTVASLLIVLAIFVFGLIPAMIITGLIVDGASTVLKNIQSGAFKPTEILNSAIERVPWLQSTLASASFDAQSIEETLRGKFAAAGEFLLSRIAGIGQSASAFLINLFITFYLLFALLDDGDRLYGAVFRAIPLNTHQKQSFFSAFASMSGATIKGMVAVGIVQGVLGGVMFWLLGIQGAFFWGSIMALLSVVPPFGAGFVWAPAGVLLGLEGEWVKGLILLAYGVGIISMADNVVRPIVVGRASSVPGFMVLVTTLGGLALFGLTGLVLGPVITSLFLTAWQLLEEDAPASSETADAPDSG